MNATTRRHAPLAALILASALALTACATTTTTTVRTPSTTPAATAAAAGSPSSAAGSPSAAAGSPSASSAPCTTHSCIISDAKSSLVGGVAKDESVMTALTCYSTSVKNPDPDIYTVTCQATYSDGSVWDGIASVLLTTSNVTWQPTQQVS